MGSPPLSQATGYGMVIGLGFLFAFAMMTITYVLRRYNHEVQTSENFISAGRSVKSGLVASAVVSSWTWTATLLQSSSITYKYGLSGAYWYASGATVQIILFSYIAIVLKRRAPTAHTFLEAIRARYGPITHGVFIVFGLMTNLLVSAMLLAGGAAVVNSLTGIPTAAACFLLPIGVVLYTIVGGIKATFLTDYIHSLIILAILFIFAFTAFASPSSGLGSPGAVYDALVAAAERHPVSGNRNGSYLTMMSQEGAVFFVINIVGNFGTVYLDQNYFNKANAAGPAHALPGYVLGGLSWFAIPFVAATTMGLSALALENTPVFPTYPNRMSPADVSAGLVLPNAAVALLGKGGAVATLLLLFMACTSAFSAELIAVSSIVTYDLYKTYANPDASGRQLINMSHAACVAYAIIMAGCSTGLYYAGISLGWLYLFMGVIIGGAVIPAALTLLWDRQSWAAATFAPPIALACSLTAWLVTAKTEEGILDVTTTGSNYPMLAGNIVALLTPVLVVPILTFLVPSGKYDWQSMKAIRKADDRDLAAAAHIDLELIPGEAPQTAAEVAAEQQHLARAATIARSLTIFLTLALLVVWPMPMYGTGYIFSRRFFTGWVVVGIIWLFCSALCVGVYPIWEGRKTSSRVIAGIIRDLTGKGRRRPTIHHGAVVETDGIGSDDTRFDGEKKAASSPAEKPVDEI